MEILLLTLLGFGMIIIDLVLIPGSLLIITGSGVILYSVFLNYQAYGPLPALIHLLLCLAAVPKLVTWGLGRVALKGEMRKEDGFVGIDAHTEMIGRTGVAGSDLRPAGTVIIDVDGEEERLDCIAEGGYIPKGERVVIFEERGPSLVVRRQPPEQSA